MKLNKEEFITKLQEEGLKIDVRLEKEQLEAFFVYKEMLIEWNNKINLTAIVDDEEIIIKHFIDCLHCTKHIEEKAKIIDVGTGAGLPGIVIAIYFQDKVSVTLLDALNKRILFLEKVIATLKLKNVEVIYGRAEEIGKKEEYREEYDVVISRAVANLSVLLEYTIPLVKVGKTALYMKGSNIEEELQAAETAIKTLGCKKLNRHEYILKTKSESLKRCLLEIIKTKKTPIIYPRHNSKIKKKPL